MVEVFLQKPITRKKLEENFLKFCRNDGDLDDYMFKMQRSKFLEEFEDIMKLMKARITTVRFNKVKHLKIEPMDNYDAMKKLIASNKALNPE